MFMIFPLSEIGNFFEINTDLGIDHNLIPYPVNKRISLGTNLIFSSWYEGLGEGQLVVGRCLVNVHVMAHLSLFSVTVLHSRL